MIWPGWSGRSRGRPEDGGRGCGRIARDRLFVTAVGKERVFDGGFESDFAVIGHFQGLCGLVVRLTLRGCGPGDTVRRQCDQWQAEFLLASFDIVEDRVQIVVEPRRVFVPEPSDFFHYGIVQHKFSFPSIVRGCKGLAANILLPPLSLPDAS